MEGIFHFQGKRRLSSMAKQYTIQPCFSDNESNSSSGDELDSATNSPLLISKKSHFFNKQDKDNNSLSKSKKEGIYIDFINIY